MNRNLHYIPFSPGYLYNILLLLSYLQIKLLYNYSHVSIIEKVLNKCIIK